MSTTALQCYKDAEIKSQLTQWLTRSPIELSWTAKKTVSLIFQLKVMALLSKIVKRNSSQHKNLTISWRRGSVQEVAWLSGGKHAGGYSYRCSKIIFFLQVLTNNILLTAAQSLIITDAIIWPKILLFHCSVCVSLCLSKLQIPRLCSLGKSGKRAITEKCFQRLPLKVWKYFFPNNNNAQPWKYLFSIDNN